MGMDNIDMDSVKVSKHTITIEESWMRLTNLQQVTSAVYFSVTERTNLASLNEGTHQGIKLCNANSLLISSKKLNISLQGKPLA